MSNSATLTRLSHAIGFRSERSSRLLKVAAFVFAAIYAVNGAGVAAGYANKLPASSDSSGLQLADMVQVGASWPVVPEGEILAILGNLIEEVPLN